MGVGFIMDDKVSDSKDSRPAPKTRVLLNPDTLIPRQFPINNMFYSNN